MGNYASKKSKVGYVELRDSIPGSLVSEQDFDLFYSLCKVESIRTISTILTPTPSQLFFVVVSGEMHVHLTSPDVKNKSMIATIFTVGETIHFFTSTLRSNNLNKFDSGECLRNGSIKLSLHFKNYPKSVARVIGMDSFALGEFLSHAQHNTHALASFLGLSLSDLPQKSPFFMTIASDQMAMFGPLMKIRLAHAGTVINPFCPPTANSTSGCASVASATTSSTGTGGSAGSASGGSTCIFSGLHSGGAKVHPGSGESPHGRSPGRQDIFASRFCTPAGPVALIFAGTAQSVPLATPLAPIISRLKAAEAAQKANGATPKMRVSDPSPKGRMSPLSRMPSFHKPKPRAGVRNACSPPAIFGSHHSRTDSATELELSDRVLQQQQTVRNGILLGMGGMLCRETAVTVRTTVTSSPCVVGYLDFSTLDTLFLADPRFKRVLVRNYFMTLMGWLKPTVPFLRDMDEWSFALMSCKVSLQCFEPDTVIYKRGEPSAYAYIIVGGSIKEVTEASSLKLKNSPTVASPGGVQIERILNAGTLFGEVALATNNPYFNTVTTREPTMVLCISKHVLEQIYNNNKTKLCEIRIRLLGGDVGLHHVIDHPRGSVLFQTYLDKELAGESLRFYCAVDRYDSMCIALKKQYVRLKKLHDEHINDIIALYEDQPSSPVNMESVAYGDYNDFKGGVNNTLPFSTHPQVEEVVDTPVLHTGNNTIHSVYDIEDAPNTHSTHHSTYHSSFVTDATLSERSTRSMQHYFNTTVHNPNASHNSMTTHHGAHHMGDTHSRSSSNGVDMSKFADNSESSVKSNGSVNSDTFVQGVEHALHHSNTVTSTTNSAVSNSPYKPTIMKPALESIISESNFSLHSDSESIGSVKISFKHKPTPHGSISLGSAFSNKIVPLIELAYENDHEPDADEDNGSLMSHTNTGNSNFTAANLRRAMQQATEQATSHYSTTFGTNASGFESGAGGDKGIIMRDGYPIRQDGSKALTNTTVDLPNAHSGNINTPGTVGSRKGFFSTSNDYLQEEHSEIQQGLLVGCSTSANAESPRQLLTSAADSELAYTRDISAVNLADSAGDGVRGDASRMKQANFSMVGSRKSPEKLQEVARSITQKLYRVQKNIVELKQVARSIMQTYIYNNSEAQLNLPDTLRIRTEKRFAQWSSSLLASVTNDTVGTTLHDASYKSIKVHKSRARSFEFTAPGNAGNLGATDATSPKKPPTVPGMNLPLDNTTSPADMDITGDTSSVSIATNSLSRKSSFNAKHPTIDINVGSAGGYTNSDIHEALDAVQGLLEESVTNDTSATQVNVETTNTADSDTNTTTSAPAPVRVTKLGKLTNPAFRSSAPFIKTYAPDLTDSTKTGISTLQSAGVSSREMNIPSPIKIPQHAFFASDSTHSSPTNNEHASEAMYGVLSPPNHDQTPPQELNTYVLPAKPYPIYDHASSITGYNPGEATSSPTSPHLPAREALDAQTAQLNHLDLSFMQLFNEARSEVVKLLRDDKFPRWKQTPEFAQFISGIKPYEQEMATGGGTRRSVNMSIMDNSIRE